MKYLRMPLCLIALALLSGQAACDLQCEDSHLLTVYSSDSSVEPGETVSLFWDNGEVYDCVVWAFEDGGGTYVLSTFGDGVAFDEPEESLNYLVSCDSDCDGTHGFARVEVIEPEE